MILDLFTISLMSGKERHLWSQLHMNPVNRPPILKAVRAGVQDVKNTTEGYWDFRIDIPPPSKPSQKSLPLDWEKLFAEFTLEYPNGGYGTVRAFCRLHNIPERSWRRAMNRRKER